MDHLHCVYGLHAVTECALLLNFQAQHILFQLQRVAWFNLSVNCRDKLM